MDDVVLGWGSGGSDDVVLDNIITAAAAALSLGADEATVGRV
jgi:hypothetical protein